MNFPALCWTSLLALAAVAPAQTLSLTTLFTSGNGRSTAGSTAMFDITVLNPAGVRIVKFDVNISALPNVTLDVYITPTTYVGKELSAALWFKVSSGTGMAMPRDTATPIDVDDFVLKPGSYGMAIHYATSGNAYTNGTGANQTYSNADMRLDLGLVTAGLFSSSVFSPRVWNGTIYYVPADKAWLGAFGTGCQGSNGVATLAPSPTSPMPQLGQLIGFDGTNLPLTPGPIFMLLGIDRSSFGPIPLPLDLTPFGLSGCNLYVAFLTALGFANLGGTGTWRVGIPNDPTLLGGSFFIQALCPDTGALPFVLTGGGQIVIGL